MARGVALNCFFPRRERCGLQEGFGRRGGLPPWDSLFDLRSLCKERLAVGTGRIVLRGVRVKRLLWYGGSTWAASSRSLL